MVEIGQLLTLVKQFGPVIASLLFMLYLATKRIDHLLDRNETIYETHIKNLWETQQRLLTALIGQQPSSQTSPTMEDLKKSVAPVKEDKPKALGEGGG